MANVQDHVGRGRRFLIVFSNVQLHFSHNSLIFSKLLLTKSIKRMPKISIIVPVYNCKKYLRQCLDSILSQTFKNWECLLIDDGSTDESGSICDEYARRDNRFAAYHKENGGLTSARNYGLERSVGEWIMHVDGDDWIEVDSIERLLQTAKDTASDMVFGDFRFSYHDKTINQRNTQWKGNKIDSLNNHISFVWTTLWSGIAKHEIYIKHNLKSPSGITYCEDFHLITRLCWFAKRISNCHYAFYNYRQHPKSIMHNLNKETETDEQWVYSDIVQFFKSEGVYEQFRRSLNWRLLKSTQDLILSPSDHKRFLELCPVSGQEIWSCPFINKMLKIMAWLLTHHARPIVVLINKVRKSIINSFNQ